MSRQKLIQQIREQVNKQPNAPEPDYSKLCDKELRLIVEICRKYGKTQLIFNELSPEDKKQLKDIFQKLSHDKQ